MTRAAWLVFAVALIGCPPPPPPVVAPMDGPWPATPEGACARLAELSCPESRTTPDGMSCPMVIRKAQQLIDMKLPCIVAADDVDAVRTCGTVRCRE